MRYFFLIGCFVLMNLSCEDQPGSSSGSLPDHDEPVFVDETQVPVSKFRCCPEFTEAELDEQQENNDFFSCQWRKCVVDPIVTLREEMNGVVGIYCEQYPEEDKVYNLTRCDSCVCPNGNTILGGWDDGIPTWHCSGGAVEVSAQGGESSCGNPNCENLCAARGWNVPPGE
ncbi:MAG: hypothetical protein CL678_04515 [Bdellovibrionaceae bacterium]|nr:hypothetical protein [Pseudobdellovibrionaceae bacterium]